MPTPVLEEACPRALWLLPDTEFTVTANFGALDEQDLNLHNWCVHLSLHRPRDAALSTSRYPTGALRRAV